MTPGSLLLPLRSPLSLLLQVPQLVPRRAGEGCQAHSRGCWGALAPESLAWGLRQWVGVLSVVRVPWRLKQQQLAATVSPSMEGLYSPPLRLWGHPASSSRDCPLRRHLGRAPPGRLSPKDQGRDSGHREASPSPSPAPPAWHGAWPRRVGRSLRPSGAWPLGDGAGQLVGGWVGRDLRSPRAWSSRYGAEPAILQ